MPKELLPKLSEKISAVVAEGETDFHFAARIQEALSSLRTEKIANPQSHLIIYRSYPYTVLLVHRSPLKERKLHFYYTWAGRINARTLRRGKKTPWIEFSYVPYEKTGTFLESVILKESKG